MCSCFKCFDQSLKAIKSLFSFCNKQELRFNHRKTYLSFSLIFLSRVEDCFEIALIKREWNRIFVCIDFRSFCNKCNPFVPCVNSGVLGREVLCALEVVKINILGDVCAEPKEVCVLRVSRSLLWWCV